MPPTSVPSSMVASSLGQPCRKLLYFASSSQRPAVPEHAGLPLRSTTMRDVSQRGPVFASSWVADESLPCIERPPTGLCPLDTPDGHWRRALRRLGFLPPPSRAPRPDHFHWGIYASTEALGWPSVSSHYAPDPCRLSLTAEEMH